MARVVCGEWVEAHGEVEVFVLVVVVWNVVLGGTVSVE